MRCILSCFFDFFFNLWLRLCQGLGLILIEFDEKKDKFYVWKFSKIYCVTSGIIVGILYPYVLIEFGKAMASMASFSFTVYVSIGSSIATYLFMLLSFLGQLKNRFKIRDSLNDLIYFYRASKQSYKEFEVKCLGVYQRDFFISVVLKFFCFVINCLAYIIVLKDQDAPFWLFLVAFPYITSMAICNQFFLGVLIIKYFLASVNRNCYAMLTKVSYFNEKIADSEMEDNLSKVAYVHSYAYKFHGDLSTYFSYQMMFNVFNSFFTIALTAFQTFTSFLGVTKGYDVGFDFVSIMIIGAVNVFVLSMDIVFHLSVCVSCSNQVKLKRF
jgi:7tm Chemosensory receptor